MDICYLFKLRKMNGEMTAVDLGLESLRPLLCFENGTYYIIPQRVCPWILDRTIDDSLLKADAIRSNSRITDSLMVPP